MLVVRLLALAAAVGVCAGFSHAPVQGLPWKNVRGQHTAIASLRAVMHASSKPIDYGVAYDPKNRRLGHVCFERPWTVVEPRQKVPVPVLHTPEQRAVYESVLLLRICVDGAEVKGVQWGVQKV